MNIWSKSGEMVRALASHQCGLGLNPGVNDVCGLSLLLVLSLNCSKRFFSGYSCFSLSSKNSQVLLQKSQNYKNYNFIYLNCGMQK